MSKLTNQDRLAAMREELAQLERRRLGTEGLERADLNDSIRLMYRAIGRAERNLEEQRLSDEAAAHEMGHTESEGV